jgi:aryl-alcohol dehydrogenase-like predicted oxidoreductase
LTGKFSSAARFEPNDHRSFRLTGDILERVLPVLEKIWKMAEEKDFTKTALALSFCASRKEISTIIPGIKTPEQAVENSKLVSLTEEELSFIRTLYTSELVHAVALMEKKG